jgi:LPXTG-motif cell wall-anchored protein
MKSKPIFLTIVAMSFAVFGALIVPAAHADEWNKKTITTFSEDVQVPGKVLPAGTYVFKLADISSSRDIVQIFNADETQLITTISAIPDYRATAPDEPVIAFDERPAGQPEAVKAWFYPGENYGLEFVYPNQPATQLAQASQQTVSSSGNEQIDSVVSNEVASEDAEPTAVPPIPASASADSQESQADAAGATPTVLPQTASSMPLVAIGGFLLLGAAFVTRRLSALPR